MDADETLPAAGATGLATAPFADGAHVAGRYRIERFIASGAMGDVYAAEDLIVGGMVALKTVRPELEKSAMALERLRREIALARTVTNPHICRLHDVGEHEGRAFITMELLDGKTLADVVAERGALPVDEVGRIAKQLVDGLAALHAAGIVHRDFKASNVMLVGERAVITDFGLARSIRPDAMASLTVEASLLGTPAYMAPEQVEGRPATPESDIYALGIVLFELVTGHVPFREETALATATARLQKDAPRAQVSPIWDARIARCLAREPAARFSRVEDVLGPIHLPTRRWVFAVFGLGGASLLAYQAFHEKPAAKPLAKGDLVAVLPLPGLDDPTRLAFSIDFADALASAGVPLLALDGGGPVASLGGTAEMLGHAQDPIAAAYAIPNVGAVVTTGTVSSGLTLTLQRPNDIKWNRDNLSEDPVLLVNTLASELADKLGPFQLRWSKDPMTRESYRAYGAALAKLFEGSAAALEDFVSANPKVARAHAWLADHRSSSNPSDTMMLARARESADHALALDPDQALAHAARGRASMYLWDWEAADASTARAVELAPTNARVALARARYLHFVNRFVEGIPLFESTFARNLRAASAISGLGWAYYYGRRYQRAIDHLKRIATDGERGTWLALSYAEMSRYEEALANAMLVRSATKDPDVLAKIVPIYAQAGRLEDARAIVAGVKDTAHPYDHAIALDAINDIDGALPLLEKIVDDHSDRAVYLKIDRFSPNLRSHPRFQKLLERVGFPA